MKTLPKLLLLILNWLVFFNSLLAQADRPLVIEKESLPCLNKTFNVIAHVVRDADGRLVSPPTAINSAIAQVNDLFASICVRFNVCEINIVENHQYNTIDVATEWTELSVLYGQPNKINIYFVGRITYTNACGIAPVSGITTPTSTRGILLPCNGALAHEMGYFFGLKHTFGEGVERTAELVKGSNCATTGDLICDTPADPYITRDSLIHYVKNCRFIFPERDAQGEWYVPHVGNIMSYYCGKEFTDGQYRLMAKTYLQHTKMW